MNSLLLPVAAYQAIRLRRDTTPLPAAAGARSGTVGTGSPLRIAVIGESTAAGCGAETQEDAIAMQLARFLVSDYGAPAVDWTVCARNGATAFDCRWSLLQDLPHDLDLAVLLVGVNDVLRRTPPEAWRAELSSLLFGLRRRSRHVLVAGLPPFESFARLPRTLARYLSGRAATLDTIARQAVKRMPGTSWVGGDDLLPLGPEFFASDGFHPSATGYRRWAKSLAPVASSRLGTSLRGAGQR